MRTLFLAALAALAFGYARLNATGPMDGSAWEVRVKPQAFFSLSHKDVLLFDSGRLRTAGGTVSGDAAYRIEVRGEPSVWTASSADAAGVVSWQGVVQGDRIEGTLVRVSGDRIERLRFEGKRKSS